VPDNEFTIRILTGAGAARDPGVETAERDLAGASKKLADQRKRLAWMMGGYGAGGAVGAAVGGVVGGPAGAAVGLGVGGIAGAGAAMGARAAYGEARAFGRGLMRRPAEMGYAEAQMPLGRLRIALESILRPSQLLAAGFLGMGKAVKLTTVGFLKLGPALVRKIVPGMLSLAKAPFAAIGGLAGGAVGMGGAAISAVFRPFTRILGDLLGPLKPAAILMKALEPALKLMAWAIRPIIAPIRELMLTMVADFVPVLRELGGMVGYFMSRVAPYLLRVTRGFAKGLSAIIRLFTDSEYTFREFKETFKGLFTGMMEMTQAALKFVYDKTKFVFVWVGEQLKWLWNTVTNNDIFKWVAEKWHGLMDTMRVAFAHVWNFILDLPLVGRAIQGLGFGKIDIDTMRQVWETQWAATQGLVKDTVEWMGEGLKTAFEFRWRTEDERERKKEARRGARIGPLRAERALTLEQLGVGAGQREWYAGMQAAARVAPGGGVPAGGILDRLLAEPTAGPAGAPKITFREPESLLQQMSEMLPGVPAHLPTRPEEVQEPTVSAITRMEREVVKSVDKVAGSIAKKLRPATKWSWMEGVPEGGL